MTPQPPFNERLAHLQRPRTENVFGEPVAPVTTDDIAVGWFVIHATDRYEAGDEIDERTGAPVGTYKGGAVVDVYEREGRRFVTVVEDRMVERRLVLRRFDWDVAELNLDRCHPVQSIGRHGAAKKMCAAIGQNVKGAWDFERDDFLVASALAITEPERAVQAATSATTCAGGHCTDVGGTCAGAVDHIGICCGCGAAVQARVRGRRVAS